MEGGEVEVVCRQLFQKLGCEQLQRSEVARREDGGQRESGYKWQPVCWSE